MNYLLFVLGIFFLSFSSLVQGSFLCNVHTATVRNFDEYADFLATYVTNVVVLFAEEDMEKTELEEALQSNGISCSEVKLMVLSRTMYASFKHNLGGNKLAIWGPRVEDDPITPPDDMLMREDWFDILPKKLKDLLKASDNAEQLVNPLDYDDIRARQSDYPPAKLLDARDDGSRPIERREKITREELLSYTLYGIPVIITDATDDWNVMKYTYDEMNEKFPQIMQSEKSNIVMGGEIEPMDKIDPSAYSPPYFLDGMPYQDDGMFFNSDVGKGTHTHNDQSCLPSFQAVIRGNREWEIWVQDRLVDETDGSRISEYIPFELPSKRSPWKEVVREGEILIFTAMMMHQTRNFESDGPLWEGKNMGLSIYYNHPRPVFFELAFKDTLLKDVKYRSCKHVWKEVMYEDDDEL